MWLYIHFLVSLAGESEGRWDWEKNTDNQPLTTETWLTKAQMWLRYFFSETWNQEHLWRKCHSLGSLGLCLACCKVTGAFVSVKRWRPIYLPCYVSRPVMSVPKPLEEGTLLVMQRTEALLDGVSCFPRTFGFLISSLKVPRTHGGIHCPQHWAHKLPDAHAVCTESPEKGTRPRAWSITPTPHQTVNGKTNSKGHLQCPGL